MVVESTVKRSWLTEKEMNEFDHITGDQIRKMTDLLKLKKLERYMREEGFPQTAETAVEVIEKLGGRVQRPGERELQFDEQDEEFDAFLKTFDSWKYSIKGADDKLRELQKAKAGKVSDSGDYSNNNKQSSLVVPSIRNASRTHAETLHPKKIALKKDVRSGSEYYEQWDKLATKCDKEISEEEKNVKKEGDKEQTNAKNEHIKKKERNVVKSKSTTEREWLANREREKGNELFKSKEYMASLDAYNLSIELFSRSAAAYANRAAVHLKLNRWDEAHADCCAALELDPAYVKALMRRGLVNLEMGKAQEAMKDLTAALELDPSNNEILSLKQKAERALPKCQEQNANAAVKSKRIAIEEVEGKEEGPKASGTLLELEDHSTCHEPQKKDNKKKVLIEEMANTLNDADSSIKTRSAAHKQEELAINSTSTISSKDEGSGIQDPTDLANEWQAAGNNYLETGDWEKAENCYITSIKYAADNAATFSKRALCRLKLRRFEDAKEDASKALRIDPRLLEAYEHRGSALQALGKIEEAMADFKRVLDNSPKHDHLRSEVNSLQRQVDEALYVPMRVGPMVIEEVEEAENAPLKTCEKATSKEALTKQCDRIEELEVEKNKNVAGQLAGASVEGRGNGINDVEEEAEKERLRGNEYFKCGNYCAAIKCYNKSLSLDPDVAATYANRALCYLKMKDWNSAKADCAEAIRVDAGYAKAFYRRALASEGLGDLRGALKDLQVALKVLPDDPELLEKVKAVKRKLRVAFVKEVTKEEAENQRKLEEACKSPSMHELKSRIAHGGSSQSRPQVKKAHPFEPKVEDQDKDAAVPVPVKNFRFSKSNTVPPKPKTTIEFQRSCERLQDQPELLRKFISSIDVNEYPGIFKEFLSTDVLKLILKSLQVAFMPHDPAGTMAVLGGLVKVKRFGLILKLLSPSEKDTFLSMFDWLRECCDAPLDRTLELKSKFY